MFSKFFIDRPIFAAVLSIVITLAGGIALRVLPVAQYPEVTPPTVEVSASYPGANAQTVLDTIAAPIEQQVNGVEGMMYLSSQCTNDGSYTLTVTFQPGSDLNISQVLVQNRVALAQPILPDLVKRRGVTVKKKSPSTLMIINLFSPEGTRDDVYLSNYATIQLRDDLSRLKGVGDVTYVGQRDYSMRVWLDPQRMQSRGLAASDVVRAVEQQNVQVAAGQIGQPPVKGSQAFQYVMSTQGRLTEPEQFDELILKTDNEGRPVFLRDVGRADLGAQQYDQACTLDGKPSVALSVYQLPGSNAIQTAKTIRDKMEELRGRFPTDVDYAIVYDTTPFIDESIQEVYVALRDAVILVAVVVLVFLRSWRSAIIPLVAVPVAVVGTFAVMRAFEFSLNNLTLFGLVLAIGIVVDDAIVVVEAVEHHIEHGLSPRDATVKAMEEVSGPVIAIGLVLCAVFVPCAFISGIVGQFFKQFAVTIAFSTLISAFNSLTLSPALCALLLRPKGQSKPHVEMPVLFALPILGLGGVGLVWHIMSLAQDGWYGVLTSALFWLGVAVVVVLLLVVALACGLAGWVFSRVLTSLFGAKDWATISLFAMIGGAAPVALRLVYHVGGSWPAPLFYGVWAPLGIGAGLLTYYGFNPFFDVLTRSYVFAVARSLRVAIVVLALYGGLLYLTYSTFQSTPTGFIPQQDKGYLLVNVQLPDAASLGRTEEAMSRLERIVRQTRGVKHVVSVSGQSILLGANSSNFGSMYVMLDEFHDRYDPDLHAEAIAARLRAQLQDEVRDGLISVFGAPPVEGLGTAGGFKIMIEDRGDLGAEDLQLTTQDVMTDARRAEELTGIFSGFRADTPWLRLEIDRERAMMQGVSMAEVFTALQVYVGSLYVNDFNRFGRTWQVNVQAEATSRMTKDDLKRIKIRNNQGGMVPLGAISEVKEINGPVLLTRYNLYRASAINGQPGPNTSSGQAIDAMEAVSKRNLAPSMRVEWTELALLQLDAGNTALWAFVMAVVLVFLVLAAQYESWALPLAVILVVPMCLLCAVTGVIFARMDVNIFTQIGFVVLVGLACKNAILIVEFAKMKREEGSSAREATLEACKLRLRPILMTSFAFILGVVPLVLAKGAGAEMRQTLGTAVFAGMLGVTLFGVFLTPVFFFVIQWLMDWIWPAKQQRAGHDSYGPSHGAAKDEDLPDESLTHYARPEPAGHPAEAAALLAGAEAVPVVVAVAGQRERADGTFGGTERLVAPPASPTGGFTTLAGDSAPQGRSGRAEGRDVGSP
jgi:multidrug efflux pump subunit AcrB